MLPKITEFHESIAQDVGVGCQSRGVLFDERGEDRVPVLLDKINANELDADGLGDCSSVFVVSLAGAGGTGGCG